MRYYTSDGLVLEGPAQDSHRVKAVENDVLAKPWRRRCIEVHKFVLWLADRRSKRFGRILDSIGFETRYAAEGHADQTTKAERAYIRFGAWAISSPFWKIYAAHELAHVMTIHRDWAIGHGPRWRREFLRLLRIFTPAMARAYRRAYRRKGL